VSTQPRDPGREPSVYLYPGQVIADAEGQRVSTILGSCVGVCLWDPERRVGGMTHYLLPHATQGAQSSPRFAEPAIRQLISRLTGLGAHPGRLVAKLFGGSTHGVFSSNGFHVGARNVAVARELLREADIPIESEDVGGSRGRKVVFATSDGLAWVKLL